MTGRDMQVVITILVWIGLGAFFWWARSEGLKITSNVLIILVSGLFGSILLFEGEGTARLLGLVCIAYAIYGVWKTYEIVVAVREKNAARRRLDS
jgi:hypothetical protein